MTKLLEAWRGIRYRTKFTIAGAIVVGLGMWLVAASAGAQVATIVSACSVIVWCATAGHITRKGLLDYANLEAAWNKLLEDPRAAAEGFKALIHFMIAVMLCSTWLVVHAAPIGEPHPKAVKHAPVIRAAVAQHWADLPWPHYIGGLIEHESCISLTHSRCWEPTSQLKATRKDGSAEEGAGLAMLTRVWRADGTVRMDTLGDLRARYKPLSGLTWANVYQRPDLQITALVLLSAENWGAFTDVADFRERLAFTDGAYNAGRGMIRGRRNRCHLTPGCDPQKWFGHAEKHCTASRTPLYGNRSACDIVEHHVSDVLNKRMPKYRRLLA